MGWTVISRRAFFRRLGAAAVVAVGATYLPSWTWKRKPPQIEDEAAFVEAVIEFRDEMAQAMGRGWDNALLGQREDDDPPLVPDAMHSGVVTEGSFPEPSWEY